MTHNGMKRLRRVIRRGDVDTTACQQGVCELKVDRTVVNDQHAQAAQRRGDLLGGHYRLLAFMLD